MLHGSQSFQEYLICHDLYKTNIMVQKQYEVRHVVSGNFEFYPILYLQSKVTTLFEQEVRRL